jgi:hypothetical protein
MNDEWDKKRKYKVNGKYVDIHAYNKAYLACLLKKRSEFCKLKEVKGTIIFEVKEKGFK